METPAGDAETVYILRKRYSSVGCYVCKSEDHVYQDCDKRPCYLCKKPGHLSYACPFRMKPGAHDAALRALLAARQKRACLGHFMRARELDPSPTRVHPSLLYVRNPQMGCRVALGLRRVHRKRITAAEWHPEGKHAVTADKEGNVRVWNLGGGLKGGEGIDAQAAVGLKRDGVHMHHCNVSGLQFDSADREILYTGSMDGIVCSSRMSLLSGRGGDATGGECVQGREVVVNLNPEGWHGQRDFRMVYGMAYDDKLRRALYVGTSHGVILRRDPREKADTADDVKDRFHKDKVTCIHVNPLDGNLIATASNDKKVCLWDARKFAPGHDLGCYVHGRLPSAAYFSPNTGSKLLTTSLDNKLQVWNDVHAFVGDVNSRTDGAPIEIVHSHDFHRHLNPFRATWDPKDWKDDLFMCGRFLGDAYYEAGDETAGGVILHPIDLFSAKTGALMDSLVDSAVALRCTTNKFSPMANCILTAASGDLVFWSPPASDSEKEKGPVRRGAGGAQSGNDGSDDDNDNNDDDGDLPQKRKKQAVVVSKRRTRNTRRRTLS